MIHAPLFYKSIKIKISNKSVPKIKILDESVPTPFVRSGLIGVRFHWCGDAFIACPRPGGFC